MNNRLADLDTSTAKCRRLNKLSALAAFKKLEIDTSETPEGTSRTEALDWVYEPGQRHGTSEPPEGTSCSLSVLLSAKTNEVIVNIDARELEIPYDLIIGRPSVCKHRLLRFDAEIFMVLYSRLFTVD